MLFTLEGSDPLNTKLSFPQQQVLVLSDNGTASTSLHVGTNRYGFIEQHLCTISLHLKPTNRGYMTQNLLFGRARRFVASPAHECTLHHVCRTY